MELQEEAKREQKKKKEKADPWKIVQMLFREKVGKQARYLRGKYQRLSKILDKLRKEKRRHPYAISPEEARYRNLYQTMRASISFPKEDYHFDSKNPFQAPPAGDPMEEVQRILELEVSNARKVNYLIAYLYQLRIEMGVDKALANGHGQVADVYRCYRRVILRTIEYLHQCTLRDVSDLHPRITVIGTVKSVVEWIDTLEKEGKIVPLRPHEIEALFACAPSVDARPKPMNGATIRKVRSMLGISEKPQASAKESKNPAPSEDGKMEQSSPSKRRPPDRLVNAVTQR